MGGELPFQRLTMVLSTMGDPCRFEGKTCKDLAIWIQMFDYQTTIKHHLDCPICGSCKNKPIFVGDRYQMGITTVICKKCGLIYTNPRPDDTAFKEFYEKFYREFYESVEHPSKEYIREGRFTQRANIVYNHLKNFIKGKIPFSDPVEVLDVGCSEGSVLRFILQNSRRKVAATGIEPSINFSRFAKGYSGAQIYTGSLEGFFQENPRSTFDIIILNHVLEHFLIPEILELPSQAVAR